MTFLSRAFHWIKPHKNNTGVRSAEVKLSRKSNRAKIRQRSSVPNYTQLRSIPWRKLTLFGVCMYQDCVRTKSAKIYGNWYKIVAFASDRRRICTEKTGRDRGHRRWRFPRRMPRKAEMPPIMQGKEFHFV